MQQEDVLLQHMVKSISRQTGKEVEESLISVLEAELAANIASMQREGDFYKALSEKMFTGMREIFKEISTATSGEGGGAKASDSDPMGKAQSLFTEATRQIDEILTTTLNAAESIMANTEAMLERNEKASAIFSACQKDGSGNFPFDELKQLGAANLEAMTAIMTDLSFQDLTGQRLKKLLSALESIRQMVLDIYLSTGLMLKKRNADPEKNLLELEEESRKEVAEIKNSELKGPSSDRNQNDVDSLLAELGL